MAADDLSGVTTSAEPPVPRLYEEFRDVIRIHLKQILRLDEHTAKVPMHTVALLVMVAYEALARYTRPPEIRPGDTHWLFAKRHEELYGIHPDIGALIFNALRNGLAHVYGQYQVPIEGLGSIRFVLTWKDGGHAHFRGVSSTTVNGVQLLCPFPSGTQEIPRVVCVDVGSLWADLDQLFSAITASFASPTASPAFEALVIENRNHFTARLQGGDPERWRSFLSARRLEADPA